MAAVKALQHWCRVQCEGYRDVSITNMTTSFRDGLAFCALIHRHRPELINFDSLKKEDVYENNKLAFSVAEQQLGIPALLDAEDMVALRVPDRLSILTYVSQYYNYFHGRSPIGGMAGVKRPSEDTTQQQPVGKKNMPVSAQVFPSSGPTKENLPPLDQGCPTPISAPKQYTNKQTGTLSSKCFSCNKHVHLVERHLVDGKLYHRNCAKTLTGNPFTADLRKNSSLSWLTPDPNPEKTSSRPAPSWLTHKPSASSTVPSGTLHLQPANSASIYSKFGTPSAVSPSPPCTSAPFKTSISGNTSTPTPTSSTAANLPSILTTPSSISVSKSRANFEEKTTTTSTTPTPIPRTSIASKSLQAKMNFFKALDGDSGGEEKGGGRTKSTERFRGQKEEHPASHSVTLVVQVGVKERQKEREREREKEKEREREQEREKEREQERAREKREKEKRKKEREEREKERERAREKEQSKAKASAAAFISEKLTEENNKSSWTVNQTHRQCPAEVQKKEDRGRVRLRANPSLLSDLNVLTPEDRHSPSPRGMPKNSRSPSPMSFSKDKPSPSPWSSPGAPKPRNTSPHPSGSQSESPSDWRARLKPVSKDPSPMSSSQSQPKPWTNGLGLPQSTAPTRPAPVAPTPRIAVTPPSQKGFSASPRDSSAEKDHSNKTKTKADYIPQEEILRELQQIEESLNDLEKTGVELELKLRISEENGEDESVMNELMVEWFTLIRNKQLAMRRESELVYIGRTQELEEEQPTVEQELRRLLDKPEHLKTPWERRREETLMKKLVEIVNDRNAIIEGLDEDRLREEEEDEQLNQLMMNFHLKKDKSKKKSPMSRLFGWSSKDA